MGEPERTTMRVVAMSGHELRRIEVNTDNKDPLGQHSIHWLAKEDNSDQMDEFLEQYPEQTLSALRVSDLMEDTPFHTAVQNNSTEWLSVVLESDKLDNIDDKIQLLQLQNRKEETPLSLATANKSRFKSSFMTILKSFKQEDYPKVFQATTHGPSESTALHQAIEMDVGKDCIANLLELLTSDQQKRQILMMSDLKGRTPLHLAAMDNRKNSGPLLKCLLNSLSVIDDRCEVLSQPCKQGFTVLHMIMDQPQKKSVVLRSVLGAIDRASKERLQTLVGCQDSQERTALHYAVETCKAEPQELQSQRNDMNARCLLEFSKLPIDLPPILKKTDSKRQTLLHFAARSCKKALQSVVEIIKPAKPSPQADLQELLQMQDSENDTVFHSVAAYGTVEMMEYLLNLEVLADETRLTSLKTPGSKQMSVLQICASRPHMANAIISMLDNQQLCCLLTVRDETGKTLLHSLLSISNPVGDELALVKTIVDRVLSAEQSSILCLVNIEDSDCNTLLHLAAKKGYAEVLRSLLQSIKNEDEMFRVLSKKESKGKSVLHQCGNDVDVMQPILDCLKGSSYLLELALARDDDGNTVLHSWCKDTGSIKSSNAIEVFLRSLKICKPQSKVEELIGTADQTGDTALHIVGRNCGLYATDFERLLGVLPEEAIGRVLKINGKDSKPVLSTCIWNPVIIETALSKIGDQSLGCSILTEGKGRGLTLLHELALFENRLSAMETAAKVVKVFTDATDQMLNDILLVKDGNGDTMFHLAAEKGRVDLIEFILQKVSHEIKLALVGARDNYGKSMLQRCGTHQRAISAALDHLTPEEKHGLIIHQDDKLETLLHNLVMQMKKGMNKEIQLECLQVLSFILESLSVADRCGALAIKNRLFGSPLEYAIDAHNSAPELGLLQEIARSMTLDDILHYFDINGQIWVGLKTDPYACGIRHLNANQRYVVKSVHEFDTIARVTEARIQEIKECIDAHEAKYLKEVVYDIEHHNGKLTPPWLYEVFEDGNSMLHKLAKNANSSTIRLFLEKLTDDDRINILGAKNRKGQSPIDLTDNEKIEKLLEWSEKQPGFYYLATAPTVLVMYSSDNRKDFKAEVDSFLWGLDRVPEVVADPKSDELLRLIRSAQTQPNISALIVVYMAHGSSGYVCTRDGRIHINVILSEMCGPNLVDKPKVLMLQACQTKIGATKAITATQAFAPAQACAPATACTLLTAQSGYTEEEHFDVTQSDVVSIIGTVNGGGALRNLMIPEFAKELGKSREELETSDVHVDITQLFYKTHAAVKKFVKKNQHRIPLCYRPYTQICELRTTLTQSLSLTKMFKPPFSKEAIFKCTAFRFF